MSHYDTDIHVQYTTVYALDQNL